jgi:type VII secretion-associated serine protease mycosin
MEHALPHPPLGMARTGPLARPASLWVVLIRLSVVLVALGATGFIGPTGLSASHGATADTIRSTQWQLSYLHATGAWQSATGAGVIVAVIDSGVDATHPDLTGQVLPGADFVDGRTDGRVDVVGHGTAVAAFIAGHNDRDGVVGLAYNAKILPIRVLDPRNEYDSAATVAKAVRWAVDHGAKVINLSLGSAETSSLLTAAIDYALDRDVVVVACDGNLSNERGARVWHPAREPGVIAVSGLDRSGRFWTGSLQGTETVLAAPSAELTAAGLHHGYWQVQGTSFAAPMVSATAALIRSEFPDLSAANVINRLIRTADDLGSPGRDPQFGFGAVDPVRALGTGVTPVSSNPLVTGTGGNQGGSKPGPAVPQVQPAKPAVVKSEAPDRSLAARLHRLPPVAAGVISAVAGLFVLTIVLTGWGVLARRRRHALVGQRGWDVP